MESRITVYTKEELKRAVERKVDTIIVEGSELCGYIRKSRESKFGSYAVIAGVMTAAAAVLASGPVGWLGASAIALLTGSTVMSIGFAAFLICLGISVIIAVCKDYDVCYENNGSRLTLTRRS